MDDGELIRCWTQTHPSALEAQSQVGEWLFFFLSLNLCLHLENLKIKGLCLLGALINDGSLNVHLLSLLTLELYVTLVAVGIHLGDLVLQGRATQGIDCREPAEDVAYHSSRFPQEEGSDMAVIWP
jgi:hypothetical protein